MRKPLVQLDDFSIRLKSTNELLMDIDIWGFGDNEIVGIMGPSGSGKTSLIKTMLGTLDRASFEVSGHFYFYGSEKIDFNNMAPKRHLTINTKYLGYIPQEPQIYFNPLKKIKSQLLENVPTEIHHPEKRLIECLEQLNVGQPKELINRYPHQLSGGQLQRCLLASAVIRKPKLILADEPNSALDAITSVELVRLIKWINAEYGMAFCIVSHDRLFLQTVCHKIYELQHGTLQQISEKYEEKAPTKVNVDKSMNQPIIEMLNVDISYDQGLIWQRKSTIVVQNLSLTINRGEKIGIIGESGSGKSTIGKVIAGLHHDYQGKFLIDQKDPKEFTVQEHATRVQMIFQDPYQSLNPKLSIRKILYYGLQLYHKDNMEMRATKLLESVGLSEKDLDKYPSQFSGGQRQRIAIARALIPRPSILVCDEIVANLDKVIQTKIFELIDKLCEKFQMTILFISHDLHLVHHFCERLIILKEGKVVEQGDTTAVFNDPQAAYTRALIEADLSKEI